MYALFTFAGYYPGGGWSDWKCTVESKEEAENIGKDLATKNAGEPNEFYWHVVDLLTSRIVSEGRSERYRPAY